MKIPESNDPQVGEAKNRTVKNKTKRPSFRLKGADGVESEYVSAGVIFYIKIGGISYYLMQRRKNLLEDFGGKSAPGDTSIEDVIIRETMEETNMTAPPDKQPTNHPLTKEFLQNEIPKCTQYLLSRSKYVLCFVRLPQHKLFDLKQFGNAEYNSEGEKMIDRELVWVTKEQFAKNTLHPRLISLRNGGSTVLP